MAILALSFGMMLPTIAEFLKNRELEGCGTEFTTQFSSARLDAVVNSSRFLVVFFQEGVRVYNDDLGTWKADEDFVPEPWGDGECVSQSACVRGEFFRCQAGEGGAARRLRRRGPARRAQGGERPSN